MKRNGGISLLGWIVIAVLTAAILLIAAAALANNQSYQREAAITPTPSITPRTARITEDPARPTSTPTPRLFQLNSAGIEVRQLQERLKALGYYTGETDGQYGGGTRSAVEAFQRQHGLEADGAAGETTLNLLYSDGAQPFSPTPAPTATPAFILLQSGSTGEEVRRLQERLKALGYYTGVIDGDFGNGTRKAVIAFQQQNGLEADGIAGRKTQNVLYSDAAKPMQVTPTPEAITVLADSLPLLVNKEHPLAEDFYPADLVNLPEYCDPSLVKIKYDGTMAVREAADALMEMLRAAKADGVVNWQVSAAYRSIADQQSILDDKVKSLMKSNNLSRSKALSAARKTVADPGTSEHHTGLAFDMTVPGGGAFATTEQCKWLHAHCWDYGFIVRYQADKEDITGFLAEAWHIRYVGAVHSLVMRDRNLCLEEYIELAQVAQQ